MTHQFAFGKHKGWVQTSSYETKLRIVDLE